jgi:hypothetical protein
MASIESFTLVLPADVKPERGGVVRDEGDAVRARERVGLAHGDPRRVHRHQRAAVVGVAQVPRQVRSQRKETLLTLLELAASFKCCIFRREKTRFHNFRTTKRAENQNAGDIPLFRKK